MDLNVYTLAEKRIFCLFYNKHCNSEHFIREYPRKHIRLFAVYNVLFHHVLLKQHAHIFLTTEEPLFFLVILFLSSMLSKQLLLQPNSILRLIFPSVFLINFSFCIHSKFLCLRNCFGTRISAFNVSCLSRLKTGKYFN